MPIIDITGQGQPVILSSCNVSVWLCNPPIENTTDINTTSDVVQPFLDIFGRTETGNLQDIKVITGMYLYKGSLLVNGVQSYDSAGNNTYASVSVEDASNFPGNVHGFHELDSVAHVAG